MREAVNGAADYQKAVTAFFTPEAYYSLEIPTNPSHQGANQYMSCTILYAYLMYEAYAEADNPDMMVVYTDIFDAGYELASGLKRTFLAFNPLAQTKSFGVIFRDLQDGVKYTVTVLHEDGRKETFTAAGGALMNEGISIKLQGMRYAHISVSVSETEELYSTLTQAMRARNALTAAYADIQGQGLEGRTTTGLYRQKAAFDRATELFGAGDYAGVLNELDQ